MHLPLTSLALVSQILWKDRLPFFFLFFFFFFHFSNLFDLGETVAEIAIVFFENDLTLLNATTIACLMRMMVVHFGPSYSIWFTSVHQVHFSPFWSNLVNFRPFSRIQSNRSIMVHIGSFAPVWSTSVHFVHFRQRNQESNFLIVSYFHIIFFHIYRVSLQTPLPHVL